MPNKPIDYKFWERIFNEVKEIKSEHFPEGPHCDLRAEVSDKDYLRTWSSVAQIADIVKLSLSYHCKMSYRGKKEFGPIDDHELTKLNGITQLRSLYISDMPITGSGFATVKNLIHLQEMTAFYVQQFDKFFDWVQNFPELVVVLLYKSPIPKPNLKNLTGNSKLREISFHDCGLTDTSIESFPAHSSLVELSLDDNNLTGEGLSFISECPLLVTLTLSQNKLTRKGISTIVNSMIKKEFVKLCIRGSVGVDNSCLREIASMTNLTELDISEANVTDNGIMRLCEMQSLRYLNVSWTKVSEKITQELHKKLPYCHIWYGECKKITPEQEDDYHKYFGIDKE
jgi:hypothetical protein